MIGSQTSLVFWQRASFAILWVATIGACTGCTATKSRSRFPAPREVTWEVARAVLARETGEQPTETEGRVLQSAWQEHAAEQRAGLLTGSEYRQRVRYDVWVTEDGDWSEVEVLAHLQSRPPAGRRAYRWERLPADARAQQLLVEIGRALRERLGGEANR